MVCAKWIAARPRVPEQMPAKLCTSRASWQHRAEHHKLKCLCAAHLPTAIQVVVAAASAVPRVAHNCEHGVISPHLLPAVIAPVLKASLVHMLHLVRARPAALHSTDRLSSGWDALYALCAKWGNEGGV